MNNFLEAVGVGIAASLFFGTILGFIAYIRYLNYKETVELAKQGLLRPKARRKVRRMDNGKEAYPGLTLTAMGSALTLGMMTIGFEPGTPFLGPWLIAGLIPLFIGISQIINSRLGRDEPAEVDPYAEIDDDEPIPPHKKV